MPLFTLLSKIVVLVFVYMSLWFYVSKRLKRNDIVDTAWGIGFILIASYTLFLSDALLFKKIVVSILVFIWGARLATHITIRNLSKNKDSKYKDWKKMWGKSRKIKSYFQIFMLQGMLMIILSLPIIFTNLYSTTYEHFSPINQLGLVIWMVGFFFEAISDWQLMVFKNNSKNKGKIITSGLWKYTRHPNYFGEVMIWWGFWLMSNGQKFWIYAILSPILISYLLLKVSGIPMLEKKYENNKEFKRYAKKTSKFFPLPPKI